MSLIKKVLLLWLVSFQTGDAMIKIVSPAFKEGNPIPIKYTCEGNDISPALSWTGIPSHAKSLVLIVDDPDAPMGTWVHWLLFNIAPTITGFSENIAIKTLKNVVEGTNSLGKTNYAGPCQPSGKHRYYFKLYALDTFLSLSKTAKKEDLLSAMQGHIIAQGQLMGTYEKKKL